MSAGAGAGGTSVGAAGAGAGAGGLVQSTFGEGTPISSYDPQVVAVASNQHSTQQEANTVNYGVPLLKQNSTVVNAGVTQAFSTGTVDSVQIQQPARHHQQSLSESEPRNLFTNWRFLYLTAIASWFWIRTEQTLHSHREKQ